MSSLDGRSRDTNESILVGKQCDFVWKIIGPIKSEGSRSPTTVHFHFPSQRSALIYSLIIHYLKKNNRDPKFA